MTRVIKIQRKFRIKFERATYQTGSIELLAIDPVDAENKFWMLDEEGALANHKEYFLETFAVDDHEIDSIIPIETTQER